jgi:hypothetical protein
MTQDLSTELALKAFQADAELSAALAEFQQGPAKNSFWGEVGRSADHGFGWFTRQLSPGFVEVRLRHKAGAEISAAGNNVNGLLAGLLGLVRDEMIALAAAAQASEPEPRDLAMEAFNADPAFARLNGLADATSPSPAQAAAESLAAATGGAVVLGPSEYVPDPSQPLTAEQKTVCFEMIKILGVDQRKAFTIAFRDSFQVPREARTIAPLITEVRHMNFCDRWSIEAGGGVAA